MLMVDVDHGPVQCERLDSASQDEFAGKDHQMKGNMEYDLTYR